MPRGGEFEDWSGSACAVNEFTGERVIPGEVNDDLWAEHVSRYAFAARYAPGKDALDIGCGAGYGTAELAHHAQAVFGIDVADDALRYARTHYTLPHAHFVRASAAALPFGDGSFDVVTAFEVIEHLSDWRALLAEARRALRRDGVFFVSTPNKSYYAESRQKDGPNPFHIHEFTFDEFETALAEFFPGVSIFLQNWSESIIFSPDKPFSTKLDVCVDSNSGSHDSAHFFLAMCWTHAHPEPRGFVYSPKASNLLRERERHIRLLEGELAQTQQWLHIATAERDALIELHAAQQQQLEQSNRWAQKLDADWKAVVERVAHVQEELRAAQARAVEVAAAYARKVGELEDENRQKTRWALDTERRLSADLAARCDELAQTVSFLDRAEATVVERTVWAQRVQARLDQLEPQLQMIRQSRWVKLGRTLGLGPRVEG
jgi:ubiquinone/menaquinone biosynthesis C-methylase UbiE